MSSTRNVAPEARSGKSTPVTYDAVVVGAGFSGLYMLHRLRALGLSVRVFEAGQDVGGTWFWNRYPGARCDTESVDYSYSFSENLREDWTWSEPYAEQSEILAYVNHVADRFGLRDHIQVSTRVLRATLDEKSLTWEILTDQDDLIRARFCVMATGCLSSAQVPEIPGLEGFAGDWYHTGAWPEAPVSFATKRVGVIGTGSSGVQVIPGIAEQASDLVVFQRTPSYVVPGYSQPFDASQIQSIKANAADRHQKVLASAKGYVVRTSTRRAMDVSAEERQAEYESRWAEGGLGFMGAFTDLMTDERSNETAAAFVREKIRSIVADPVVAEMLTPRDYPIGAKRLCVSADYYATFNRGNVRLVDLRSNPILEVDETGIRTTTAHHDLDSIVFATGFDAMTGALNAMDISGRGGETLASKWSDGPVTYLGLGTANFPNLFLVTGPGSPSILTNVIVSIEQHVDWIADCINFLTQHDLRGIEPSVEAEDEWSEQVIEVAERTLLPRAASWWTGANIPGKPNLFMAYAGSLPAYRAICDDIVANGYSGFILLE